MVKFPLPSTSGRVVLVVRHFGPFAHCHQHSYLCRLDRSEYLSKSCEESNKRGKDSSGIQSFVRSVMPLLQILGSASQECSDLDEFDCGDWELL